MRDSDSYWDRLYNRTPITVEVEPSTFWGIVAAQDITWVEQCQRVSEEARAAGF